MPEEEKKVTPKRLFTRRWTRPCKECGEIIVFLENSRALKPGKRWQRWVLVEMFGERDGEPMFWDGGVVFDPRVHVEHLSCPMVRRKKAWLIRRAQEDI